MADLLDASVWLPLSAAGHAHHDAAVAYWTEESAGEVVFCRVTMLALLRHLTNPRIMGPDVQTGAQAWGVYDRWLAVPGVGMVPEADGVEDLLAEWSATRNLRSAIWTDAYLAAFALAGDHRLVAFDADFDPFPGLDLLRLTG